MKERIKNIALGLFMKYGIKSVSMDDIAKEAGISKKTIYQHITDKKTLILETLQDFISEDQRMVREAIGRKDIDAVEQMIIITTQGIKILKKIKPTVIYDLQKYYSEAWSLVEDHHFGFMRSIIHQNIEQGKKEKNYRADIDATIISNLFVNKMIMLSDEEEFPAAEYDRAYLFGQQLLYHLHGIVHSSQYQRLQSISSQLQQIN